MRSVLALIVAPLAALAGASLAGSQAAPSASELATQIQAHYDTVRSFKAGFRQTKTGGFLRQPDQLTGEVLMLKPGRMRWTYTTGQRAVFVSDGTTLYTYVPVDKFGESRPMPKDDDAPMAMLFLAGRGNLLRDFTPSVPPVQPDGEWHLTLTPKKPQADFEWLTLIVRRGSLVLTGLVTKETQGATSTFRFQNLQENARLTDRDFAFTFPPGTKIPK
jgi:outer membrane lipoprotein carrier protein